MQRMRRRLTLPEVRHLNASPELRSQLAAGGLSASPTHKGAMDPRLLAFEAARRQFVDGDATAAARDLAHAFGAVHPEAGTLRAIHAVIDQLDNPATTRLRSPATGTRTRSTAPRKARSIDGRRSWWPSSLKKKSRLEPSRWKKRWTPTCLQRWLADPNSNPDPEP